MIQLIEHTQISSSPLKEVREGCESRATIHHEI
jgi:hypothetical protein